MRVGMLDHVCQCLLHDPVGVELKVGSQRLPVPFNM